MRLLATVAGLAIALGLTLAGCGTTQAEGPTAAERETAVIGTATVESIDQESREVVLRTEDGRQIGIVAGPEVRNLAQLEAGDVVRVEYYEAVAARMAEPGEAEDTMASTSAGRAAEGEKPGAFAAAVTEFTVEVVSYDPETAVAVLAMPDGEQRAVAVAPEMEDFAAARAPGDRVRVTMLSAVAITIDEIEE